MHFCVDIYFLIIVITLYSLVHRSNKCILKTFFKRTKLLGWDEFSKNHCIITDIKQSCVLRVN